MAKMKFWIHQLWILHAFRKNRNLAVFLVVLNAAQFASLHAQEVRATIDTNKDGCSVSCSGNVADCHLTRARFLITGIHFKTRGCPDEDYSSLAALRGLEKSLVAVTELEKAIENSSRKESGLLYEYKLLANAKITLGNSFLAAERYGEANKSFTEAYNLYIRISEQLTDTEDIALLGDKLIRAGKPVEAIKYLTPIASSSPTRAYLLAEAYFSLGQRETAATFYEKWIDLGCKSNPTMILNEEHGSRWALLNFNGPRCEQLPLELRARLELLQRQYKNLKNLPAKNFPSSLMLAHP